ncbi:MAG: hypothetical protein AMJ43_10140 [Coxiella sp. DG_40]|nr:MAG: hypothetical protein AMJ43_10140 [Coxiella sp. DG_40]
MFTIDLLKGQGIPVKSRPESIAIAVIILAVPIVAAVVMFGFYLHTRVVMSIQEQGIAKYDTKIAELSDAIKLQESFKQEKNIINGSLSEVRSSIDRYIQWSPILVMLVENMPDSVVLTSLEVERRINRIDVPSKDNPKKKEKITVPVRTLRMSLSGSPYFSSDQVVEDYRVRLSTLLGPKLKEDIRVSIGSDTLEGKEVVSYEIDCVFKSQL